LKEAVFQYLCRNCEKTFEDGITGEQRAMGVLIQALCGKKDITRIPPLFNVHQCFPDRVGVADLIGYLIRETN